MIDVILIWTSLCPSNHLSIQTGESCSSGAICQFAVLLSHPVQYNFSWEKNLYSQLRFLLSKARTIWSHVISFSIRANKFAIDLNLNCGHLQSSVQIFHCWIFGPFPLRFSVFILPELAWMFDVFTTVSVSVHLSAPKPCFPTLIHIRLVGGEAFQ